MQLNKTRGLWQHLISRKGLIAGLCICAIGTALVFSLSALGPLNIFHANDTFNNEGLSSDSNTSVGNFDGAGNSYSNTALSNLGFNSGSKVVINGISFTWPTLAPSTADNWISDGQVLSLHHTHGTILGFLGSATKGPSSGVAMVTYTDTSTQTFTLTLSDWTLGARKFGLAVGDTVAATIPYRNTRTGHQNLTTYLFYTYVVLDASKIVRSVKLPSAESGGQLHIFSVGIKSSGTPTTSEWSTYLGNSAHTGFNANENILNASNVSSLALKWTVSANGGISVQPIEAAGNIYWGSWDGILHDTNLAGVEVWKTPLGITTDTDPSCPTSVGITSTATYARIGSTATLFVGGGGNDAAGGGHDFLYAFNATNGTIIWKTVVGSPPDDMTWSSPVLYNGSVFYGIASLDDCPLVRGRIYKIDASNGAIQGIFCTQPSNCAAGGVWGTPSIDTTTGMLYAATGNSESRGSCRGQPGDYGASILELNTATMSYVASWQLPQSQQNTGDPDFGSSPTLFNTTIRGVKTPMLGVANKNGMYYAFNRTNIASGPVWTDHIATGGPCPQCGDGSISPSAWDGRVLYVASGHTTINGQHCSGSVRAIELATGAYIWQGCTVGPVLGAVMAIPGVVIVDDGTEINALNTSNGGKLYSYADDNPGSIFYGAACVINGGLYAANMDGKLYAFGL